MKCLNCKKEEYIRGVCSAHYILFLRLVKKEIRTWDEIVSEGMVRAVVRKVIVEKEKKIKVPVIKKPALPLQEIFKLRQEGQSMQSLAIKYNCHHSTLFYHFKINKIKPLETVKRRPNKKRHIDYMTNFPKVKSYKDYLKEEEERKKKRKMLK